MAEDEIPSKALTMQLASRPRLQGIDDVSNDAWLFGLRNCRLIAMERDRWRKRLEEVKTQHSVVAPMMVMMMMITYLSLML